MTACHVIWGLEHKEEKRQYFADFVNVYSLYIYSLVLPPTP
ncbi:hypothetical protein A5482_010410 [Cyanobacterium sp. IPPAS B-1200]|nr:hypothetical protein [Cyanobacterium sp. IPPAS B-1200]